MIIEGKKVVMIYELRDIYDGWSVARLEDGTFYNRWPGGDRRHEKAQEFIERASDE